MKCFGCGRIPDEIFEYREMADFNDCTSEQIVVDEEGTFDPETKYFTCTDCYFDFGLPTRHELLINYAKRFKGELKNG